MYRTVVTICTTSLTFINSTFCPHSVFMCFVWISEQTAIISLYNINWLICITETKCVYCAVRTGELNITLVIFYFELLVKRCFSVVGTIFSKGKGEQVRRCAAEARGGRSPIPRERGMWSGVKLTKNDTVRNGDTHNTVFSAYNKLHVSAVWNV